MKDVEKFKELLAKLTGKIIHISQESTLKEIIKMYEED